MLTTRTTPEEVQRAGILASQVLQGKRLFFVRVNPSLAHLRRVTDELLKTVWRIDPTNYVPNDFETVLGVLAHATERLRSFYVLYNQGGDLEFMRAAAEELHHARRWVIQGLSPDPSRRPSVADLNQLSQESMQALLEASLSS